MGVTGGLGSRDQGASTMTAVGTRGSLGSEEGGQHAAHRAGGEDAVPDGQRLGDSQEGPAGFTGLGRAEGAGP